MTKKVSMIAGLLVSAVGAMFVLTVGAFAQTVPTPDFSTLGSTAQTQLASLPSLVTSVAPMLIGAVLIFAGLGYVIRKARSVVR